MDLLIPTDTIKEIASELELGMKCFYHLLTGELESYPDELRYDGFDEEEWKETINKIEKNRNEYISFENMSRHESFQMMKTFIGNIPDQNIRQRFEDAIDFKKPFQNFKQLLFNYPDLPPDWFAFKNQKYVDWVQRQLDKYRSDDNTTDD